MSTLSEGERITLVRSLCNLAADIRDLRGVIEFFSHSGEELEAISRYVQFQWAPLGAIAYSQWANEICQRLLSDLAIAKSKERLDLTEELGGDWSET
jgi:hypothetical protein